MLRLRGARPLPTRSSMRACWKKSRSWRFTLYPSIPKRGQSPITSSINTSCASTGTTPTTANASPAPNPIGILRGMGHQWKKLGDISQANLTPMLRQYLEAKAESGDSLLFFRMGDFYELFFEDAVEAAELLGIALTSRDAVNKDDRIPMAGVPVRAVDSYLAKVIRAGR